MNDALRFVSRIKKSSNKEECWVWEGDFYPNGYGRFAIGAQAFLAHRYSYEFFREPIADGLTIDHLCRNTKYVNPYHLEAVSCKTNVLRGIGPTATNSQKTHCIHGHPFSGNNLTIKIRKDGVVERVCKECRRQYEQKRRHIHVHFGQQPLGE